MRLKSSLVGGLGGLDVELPAVGNLGADASAAATSTPAPAPTTVALQGGAGVAGAPAACPSAPGAAPVLLLAAPDPKKLLLGRVQAMRQACDKADLLEMAAIIGECKSDEEKKLVLELRDGRGDTALLHAVRAQRADVAGVLVFLGANVNASDAQGLTAPFLAAKQGDIVSLDLFTSPKVAPRMMDGLRFDTAAIEKLVAKLVAAKPGRRELDKIVGSLVGVKPEHFSDALQLQKYQMHLEHMTENPLGVEAQGWFSESFLPMRIRSLVDLAMAPHAVTSGTLKVDEVRASLCREIAIELETLRIRRRNLTIGNVALAKPREALAAIEARSIVLRALRAPQGFEISIPGGWQGHATYTNLARRMVDGVDVISFIVDNRGAGLLAHPITPEGDVYSYAFNIPVEGLEKNPAIVQQLTEAVKQQLLLKVSPEAEVAPAFLYRGITSLRAILLAEYGPVVAKGVGEGALTARSAQTAGNCVVANHDTGVLRRLGDELGENVRAAESANALQQVFAVMTPSALAAAQAANVARVRKANAELREKVVASAAKAEEARKKAMARP